MNGVLCERTCAKSLVIAEALPTIRSALIQRSIFSTVVLI